ncbi:MAG: AtpZ/AtpI family protein [Planctomycetes bacterium]|nr:AtpZ/AtpI family protein [Planctomycetota bacterium]
MTNQEPSGAGPSGTTRSPTAQKAIGAGLTLAASVGVFAYGGLWLDRTLGTRPWLLLLMVALGIGGGMLHLIYVVAPDMWPFAKPASDESNDPDE